MPRNKGIKRKSNYNPDRMTYLSADGKYYCYDRTDENGHTVTTKIEVTPELEQITLILDEMDYKEDLSDRYNSRLIDPEFSDSRARVPVDDDDDGTEAIDKIAAPNTDPHSILFEEEESDPLVEKVRDVVDNQFTDNQRDLFFRHYGMGQQLETIRQDEAKVKGKLPGQSAMTGRKNKMINKVAKALGAEPPKKRSK